MLDLAPGHLDRVRAILARRVPLHEVRAFGSRVLGLAKPWSDLDLVVMTTSRLPIEVLAALRMDFDESDLPISVDVVDYSTLSLPLRRLVEESSTVVHDPRRDTSVQDVGQADLPTSA